MRFQIAIGALFCAQAFGQYLLSPSDPTMLAIDRTTNGYDYVPAVMIDGVNRSGRGGSRQNFPGDHIFYAEATNFRGPWHAPGTTQGSTFVSVLGPTGNTADFDGAHTCDPSVVRANGVYYLYYGGNSGDPNPLKAITAIG